LHTGVEAADEAHTGERDLSDQGPAPSRDARLVGEGSEGLALALRLVGVWPVWNRVLVELVEPAELGVSAPLWRGRTRPQDA
jgi:hypothetical protein